MWDLEQELLGECYDPKFHTSEREDIGVIALASFVGVGTYMHECKKSQPGLADLEAAVRPHSLPGEFCSADEPPAA